MFGNSFEPIINPHGAYKNRNLKAMYRWSTFLTLNNDPDLSSQYIKRVVYFLHPSYKQDIVVID